MKKELIKIKASDSPFSKRLKGRLKSEKNLFLSLLIINLIGLPVLSVSWQFENWLTLNGKWYMNTGISSLAARFGQLLTAAGLLAGLLCALKMFSHLHRQDRADMIFALPADRKTGFFADYLAGLALYIIPALPGIVLTIITLAVGQTKYRSGGELFEYCSSLNTIYQADMFTTTAEMTAALLLAMIMFYTVSVMCTVKSSSAIGTIISAAAYNTAVPAAMTMAMVFSGTSFITSSIVFRFTVYGSPAGVLLSAIPHTGLLHPVLSTAVNIAVTALLFASAYRSYMKSLPENISNPKSEPLIYCIVIYSATLFISGFMESITGIPSYFYIAASLVLLVCAEIIRKKRVSGCSFSSVWPASVFAAAVISVLLLPDAGRITGEFGEKNLIPDISSVKAVNVGFDGGFSGAVFQYEFTEPESIEKAEEIHRTALGSQPPDESEAYYDSYGNLVYKTFRINYLLKNNRIIERMYCISEENREDICRILASQPLRENLLSNIRNDVYKSNGVAVYLETVDNDMKTKAKRFYVNLNEQLRNELFSAVSNDIYGLTDEDFIDYTNSNWFDMQNGGYRIYLESRNQAIETYKLLPETEEFIRNNIALPDYETR